MSTPLMARATPPDFLAPFDDARGPDRSDHPALEIVSLRSIDGADPTAFITTAWGTEAMLRARGTPRRRILGLDETGTWSDIVEWTSMAAAFDTAEDVMRHALIQRQME